MDTILESTVLEQGVLTQASIDKIDGDMNLDGKTNLSLFSLTSNEL